MANGRSSQRITIPNNLVGFFELDSVDSVFVEASSLIVLGWLPAFVIFGLCAYLDSICRMLSTILLWPTRRSGVFEGLLIEALGWALR